jgi:hypothetical protein
MTGDYIDNIHQNWARNYNLLEGHHGYIQWLFPIHESGLNCDAQVLQRHEAETMKQSKDIMIRVIRSYRLMLGFYGADLVDEETGQLRRARNYQSRFENLNRFSHNYLRITRILKFLGEVGLEKLKLPFLTFFIQEVLVNKLIPNCLGSLERFWMPTLREDADLQACARFLLDPTSWPPVSVLLDPSTGARAPTRPVAASGGAPAESAARRAASGAVTASTRPGGGNVMVPAARRGGARGTGPRPPGGRGGAGAAADRGADRPPRSSCCRVT